MIYKPTLLNDIHTREASVRRVALGCQVANKNKQARGSRQLTGRRKAKEALVAALANDNGRRGAHPTRRGA